MALRPSTGMGVMRGTAGGRRSMIREEEEVFFKTNAVWKRRWRKEQEERGMNTRKGRDNK